MGDGAKPGDADCDGARPFFRQGGELARGLDLHRRVHHQHGRVEHRHADRREILDRVVAQVAAQCRIDRDRAHRGEEQGVAVGVRLGDVFGRDRAVRARPVLDDDGLSEQSSEPLGEEARDEIGGAAGGEGDHELDRPVGIVLRLRAARCRQGERGGGQGDKGAAEDGHAANNNDGPRDRHGAVPACDPRPRS